MAVEIKPEFEARLRNEKTIYLTTVQADGTPQPVPVWFLWENGSFLIYSQPRAHKLKNIAHNPRVALSFSSDEWGDEFLVVIGEARIDPQQPLSHQVPAFLEKYRDGIKGIQMTPESMAREFSVAIRVTPLRIRGE